jgi:hypothetical protein
MAFHPYCPSCHARLVRFYVRRQDADGRRSWDALGWACLACTWTGRDLSPAARPPDSDGYGSRTSSVTSATMPGGKA